MCIGKVFKEVLLAHYLLSDKLYFQLSSVLLQGLPFTELCADTHFKTFQVSEMIVRDGLGTGNL